MIVTSRNPCGADLLRALTHSLFVEETRMTLTFDPNGRAPRPRMPHSLFAADETTLTPAGAAWLARQPLPADHPDSIRARMASEIARAVSAAGCVTEHDLARAGFSRAEIDEHLAAAVRQSGALAMAT